MPVGLPLSTPTAAIASKCIARRELMSTSESCGLPPGCVWMQRTMLSLRLLRRRCMSLSSTLFSPPMVTSSTAPLREIYTLISRLIAPVNAASTSSSSGGANTSVDRSRSYSASICASSESRMPSLLPYIMNECLLYRFRMV